MFFKPQTPGGRIRPLGFRANRRDGLAALPHYVRCSCARMDILKRESTGAKRRQALPRVRAYARIAKRTDVRARRLR